MRRSRSNRRPHVLTLVGLALACGGPRAARAQSAPPVEGAAFLLIPVGARAAATGQAAMTDAGTSEAVFWNPAGLASLPHTELAIHHSETFAGPGDAVVLAVPSARLGTFAIAGYIVDYGSFDVTPSEPGGGPPPGPVATAEVRNIALSATYATPITKSIAAGIGYQLVQFRVDCSGDCSDVPPGVGTTQSVDAGAQLRLASGRVVLGLAARNIGFKLQVNNEAQADPLPARLQGGVQWQVVPPPAGHDGFDVRAMADVRTGIGAGRWSPLLLLGLDAGVRSLVRLRAGYAFLDSEERGPSLGIGLQYASFAFDIARVFYETSAIDGTQPMHLSLRLFF